MHFYVIYNCIFLSMFDHLSVYFYFILNSSWSLNQYLWCIFKKTQIIQSDCVLLYINFCNFNYISLCNFLACNSLEESFLAIVLREMLIAKVGEILFFFYEREFALINTFKVNNKIYESPSWKKFFFFHKQKEHFWELLGMKIAHQITFMPTNP